MSWIRNTGFKFLDSWSASTRQMSRTTIFFRNSKCLLRDVFYFRNRIWYVLYWPGEASPIPRGFDRPLCWRGQSRDAQVSHQVKAQANLISGLLILLYRDKNSITLAVFRIRDFLDGSGSPTRTAELQIRIRTRILFLSLVALKMLTKSYFCLLLSVGTFTSALKNNKS